MTKFIASLLLLASLEISNARLGDNMDQLTARYGQPELVTRFRSYAPATPGGVIAVKVEGGPESAWFTANGIKITVNFSAKGLSTKESFSRLDGQPLTADMIKQITKGNSFGRQWFSKQQEGRRGQFWETNDGFLNALLSEDQKTYEVWISPSRSSNPSSTGGTLGAGPNF